MCCGWSVLCEGLRERKIGCRPGRGGIVDGGESLEATSFYVCTFVRIGSSEQIGVGLGLFVKFLSPFLGPFSSMNRFRGWWADIIVH